MRQRLRHDSGTGGDNSVGMPHELASPEDSRSNAGSETSEHPGSSTGSDSSEWKAAHDKAYREIAVQMLQRFPPPKPRMSSDDIFEGWQQVTKLASTRFDEPELSERSKQYSEANDRRAKYQMLHMDAGKDVKHWTRTAQKLADRKKDMPPGHPDLKSTDDELAQAQAKLVQAHEHYRHVKTSESSSSSSSSSSPFSEWMRALQQADGRRSGGKILAHRRPP